MPCKKCNLEWGIADPVTNRFAPQNIKYCPDCGENRSGGLRAPCVEIQGLMEKTYGLEFTDTQLKVEPASLSQYMEGYNKALADIRHVCIMEYNARPLTKRQRLKIKPTSPELLEKGRQSDGSI